MIRKNMETDIEIDKQFAWNMIREEIRNWWFSKNDYNQQLWELMKIPSVLVFINN